jgi:cyclohexanone monooxygenase
MMHLQLGFTPTKLRAKTRYFECSITLVEQHVEWIGDCIDYMRKARKTRIEATIEAQEQWVDHVNEIVNMTLYPNTNSWYMSGNIAGKPRAFLPYLNAEGVGGYRRKCAEVAANRYEGFSLR